MEDGDERCFIYDNLTLVNNLHLDEVTGNGSKLQELLSQASTSTTDWGVVLWPPSYFVGRIGMPKVSSQTMELGALHEAGLMELSLGQVPQTY
jgi:hypothetical protein